jgi:hypothetical protein
VLAATYFIKGNLTFLKVDVVNFKAKTGSMWSSWYSTLVGDLDPSSQLAAHEDRSHKQRQMSAQEVLKEWRVSCPPMRTGTRP